MKIFRGSQKHVLDWVEQDDFTAGLNRLLEPSGAVVESTNQWIPIGHDDPKEARLETFGPKVIPDADWPAVRSWWLAHERGANTPNWDLAATCRHKDRTGLVLVEAKANVSEIKADGKPLSAEASDHSQENDERIGQAIEQARAALDQVVPGVQISKDTCYQLSNRVAFGWKLASMGVPVVLVYLGFLGDEGIQDAGEPFRDADHWKSVFQAHARPVLPEGFTEREIACGEASLWLIVRARGIAEPSVAKGQAS